MTARTAARPGGITSPATVAARPLGWIVLRRVNGRWSADPYVHEDRDAGAAAVRAVIDAGHQAVLTAAYWVRTTHGSRWRQTAQTSTPAVTTGDGTAAMAPAAGVDPSVGAGDG